MIILRKKVKASYIIIKREASKIKYNLMRSFENIYIYIYIYDIKGFSNHI